VSAHHIIHSCADGSLAESSGADGIGAGFGSCDRYAAGSKEELSIKQERFYSELRTSSPTDHYMIRSGDLRASHF
jgi:hypothetical protein